MAAAATATAATRGGGGGGGGGGGEGAKKREEEEEEEKTKKRKISSLDSSLVAAPTSSKSTLRETLRALDASLRSKLDSISEKLVLTTTTTTTTTTTSFKAPSSLTSAIGDAQEKQQLEERQKGEEKQNKLRGNNGTGGSSKDKVKNKQDYLQDEMQPWVKPVGASLADPEQGPFIAWCEEHFREVTMADAKKLIPSTSQPRLEEDPDFCTLPEKERSYYEGARSILFFFKMCFFFSSLSLSLSNLCLFQIHLFCEYRARAFMRAGMDRLRWQIVKLMID
jgi:hypothetical protein